MRILSLVLAGAVSTASLTAVASADGHIAAAIKERQSIMKGYGKNLGILGDMAKGQTAYDATAASAAAAELAKLANMDQSVLWPVGSDTSVKGSRALPKIWDNMDDVMKISMDMATGADAMAAAAGNGLPALQAAMGGVGAPCGACHKVYRQPK